MGETSIIWVQNSSRNSEKMMPNVALFINNISNGGGTEVVSKSYAFRLLERGDSVHFITSDFTSVPVDLEGTSINIFPLRERHSKECLNESQIQKAVEYCKSHNIDRSIFVLNVPHKYSQVSNIELIKRVAAISATEVVFHNSPRSYLKYYWNTQYSFLGNVLRKARNWLIRAPYAKRFIKSLHLLNVKMYTICHGCQNEMQKYFGAPSEIRYNPYEFLPQQDFVKQNIVSYCGRLVTVKNISLLLSAWKMAHTENWTLQLIGDGSQRSYLQDFCKKNGLTNVEFVGNVPHSQIYDYLKKSKIFCFTSNNEGWGMVLAEAMNMRNAVVTTAFDGFTDELLNKDNSVICPFNAKRIADALDVLMKDPSKVDEMGLNAYESCQAFYTSKNYLEGLN